MYPSKSLSIGNELPTLVKLIRRCHMKINPFSRDLLFPLVLLTILLLSLPTLAASEEKKTTVDDLFQFLLDNWANKIHLSVFEGSVVTGEFLVGIPLEPNYGDAFASFTDDLISAEPTYAHLAEYWQLRAHLDIQPKPDWKALQKEKKSDSVFNNRLSDPNLNSDDLKRALEINPSDGSIHWYIGAIQIKEKYPEPPSLTDPSQADKLKDYYQLRLDVATKSEQAEPSNAFYPMEKAVFEFKLGNKYGALENLKRIGECSYYCSPRIFPSSYALEHIFDYEAGKKPFDKMTPGAKWYLYFNFYGTDSLPNYIRIKDMYKGLIADSMSNGNWRETFNILNRAACIMGRDGDNGIINSLVAIVCIRLCLKEGMKQAIKDNDRSLERAIIAATCKTNDVKLTASVSTMDENAPFYFLYSMLADQFNLTFDSAKPFMSLTKLFPPKLCSATEYRLHYKRVKPAFENLITFDYLNPEEWYNTWFKETFPEEKQK